MFLISSVGAQCSVPYICRSYGADNNFLRAAINISLLLSEEARFTYAGSAMFERLNRFHPCNAVLKLGVHVRRAVVVDAAVARQNPFEFIVQKLLHRFSLLSP